MGYAISNVGGTVTVTLSGELTLKDEEAFRGASFEVQKLDASKCIIDVSDLSFLDSAGLGLLLVMKELCEESDKTVTLRIGSSPVREILEISEFDSLIPYEDA